jgi:hypothetical protein
MSKPVSSARMNHDAHLPLPYSLSDRVLELVVLPLLLSSPSCLCCRRDVHPRSHNRLSFFLIPSDAEKALVSAAHRYNVEPPTSLPEWTRYELKATTLHLLNGELSCTLLSITCALFYGWVSVRVPREKLLRIVSA